MAQKNSNSNGTIYKKQSIKNGKIKTKDLKVSNGTVKSNGQSKDTNKKSGKFNENLPFYEKLKYGYHPMSEGVRWSERYADKIERMWAKLPKFVGSMLATLAVFILGTSVQGDWIVIGVHFLKQIGYLGQNTILPNDATNKTLPAEDLTDTRSFFNSNLFDHWLYFVTCSTIGSYVIFFGIGGFLHWYFYVRQRDRAHEWKCQPDKWLTPEIERHEIILGSSSMFLVSVLTGTLACYVYNNGPFHKIYYDPSEYGWLWFFLQIPAIFIYQDYGTYLTHRMYHIPFLYKHFHKLHHTYKQPTAFSVTAIHPIEIVHMQTVLILPMFVVPTHWVLFYSIAFYTYYHAILDHSGITFKAQWWQPWQPDAIFHDNHHQYTHVNFGFNILLWDRLHGTMRRKDRVYNENIFFGKGLALDEVSKDDLMKDIAERKSENPLAYRDNVNVNDLTDAEVKIHKS